ncbi:polyprenyl synthetase family protein [Amycolatopsis acidicola]|uniref:Polyprenyl synthetase family protein n=1 Tax=Amycolatopsis acidicola TaxID=2596893 RepID=A0A5N0UXS4_9PSEU|nr:polyprenyl synthetase family protein [Amycolatopsis acidicola]KAA9154316.1 polyprenyl synthetase family protein [Amycolatopsis acidicola]
MSARLHAVTAEVDFGRIARAVDTTLEDFLEDRARHPIDRCLPPLVDVVREFLGGGGRSRPLFCYCGWLAGDGDPAGGPVPRLGAALELFHAFALIHDDVLDGAALREGRPTVHRLLRGGYHGKDDSAAGRFGVNAAILLGDLCLTWADELLYTGTADQDRIRRAEPVLHSMRSEVLIGQYLDLEGGWTEDVLDRSWRTLRHKTAAFTVERPLQVGALAAGVRPEALRACGAYGRPLGEAFQLEDEMLGVFGDRDSLGALRAGKRTVLMALTWRRAGKRQRELIGKLYGDPELDRDGAERLRTIVQDTGADLAIGDLIEARKREALAALATPALPRVARGALARLAGGR